MKKFFLRQLLVVFIIFLNSMFCCTYATDAVKETLDIIKEKYYYSISPSTNSEIQKIMQSNKTDEEKITDITKLLDIYSEYYSVEYCNNLTHSKEEDQGIIGFETVNDVYIRINSFTSVSGSEFNALMEKFSSEKPLYLDLSNCGGGFISSMLEVAEWLMPPGLVCRTSLKDEKRDYIISANEKYNQRRQLFIIVSKNTASAGEILAGAVLKSGSGTVVGYDNSTFGKTQIQEFIMLKNGGVLKITVGEYLIGKNWNISQTGIKPKPLIKDNSQQN